MPFRGNRAGSRSAGYPVQRSLAGLLWLYKRSISPFLPSACRFYPSCSEYMREAILEHGALRGLKLGLFRLAKCHPWHPGGIDPVPTNRA